MGVVVGAASDYLIDTIHAPDFMRPVDSAASAAISANMPPRPHNWSAVEKGKVAAAPKAAFLVTIYSAIPAMLEAYGWYIVMK